MSPQDSLKSFTSSPLESISETTTASSDAFSALPPSAYAYASAAKSLHSSSSVKAKPSSSKKKQKEQEKQKKKKTMTAEEHMAMLLQFKEERDYM
jgi:hypothetical protein